MKELKDYIHLYLGCEVLDINHNKILTLVGIEGLLCSCKDFHESLSNSWKYNVRNVKPILRPLSDMTDEEMLSLIRINHSEISHPIIRYLENDAGVIWFSAKDRRMKYFVPFNIGLSNEYKPNEFYWLLSKHFDLFGLIDAGLAIDATTLKATVQ